MLDTLRRWFGLHPKAAKTYRRPRIRLALESLEGRWAPAVLTVNSIADNTTSDSVLTFREAIKVVNGNLGRSLSTAEKNQVSGILGTNDTIQFSLPAGPQAITLTGGMLQITKAVAINGPGASTLTISGNNLSRVFYVGASFSQNLNLAVSLSGMTVASGKDAYGGGLFNAVKLTLTNVTINGNTATTNGGGGVYNNGSLSLNGCTFTNNTTLPNGTSSTSGGGLLNITAGIVNATGCTFTGNKATGTGSAAGQGGALANSGSMTVVNSTISNNTAAFGGGGVYNGTGSLVLTGCTISNNIATPNTATPTQGGGLLNELNCTATVTNCTFSGNQAQGSGQFAGQGGGIYNSGGVLNVSGGSFTSNSAASDGGGIYTRITGVNNLVGISNVTFTNNYSASDGGAIRAHFSAIVTITGCTFVGNNASSEGGAIDGSVAAKMTINNSTFTNNYAGTIGGALNCGLGTVNFNNDTITGNRVGSVYGGGINIRSTNVFLQNTIVAGNFQGSGTSTPNNITGYNFSTTKYVADPSSSYNIIGPGGTLGGLVNGVNHNQVGVTNLGIGPLASNGGPTQTMALLPGSPAIDQGGNAVAAGTTDQRGLPRIVNGTVDIGAYEVQPPPGPAASTLSVSGLPTSLQAGTPGTITVTAKSSGGATATSYTGTIHFTSSDLQAGLPADYTFTATDNGVHTFSVTLKTAGTQSVTATDTVTASITGTQSGIGVTPAAASTFIVAGFPNPTTAGVSGAFTVTARDAYGNTVTGYAGTVHFTSTDTQANLPADYTFVAADNGVHSFNATFNTAGLQSVTTTDTTNASITGTHAGITVYPVATGPVLLVNSTADNTSADNVLTLREALAVNNGTLGRALTAGEQAQISGTLGPNNAIQFNLPAGPQTITLTGGALSITQPVSIIGPGAAQLTVNGNNADRVFIVGYDYSQNLSLNVAISGVTISGGSAVVSGYGGGLLNFGTLTLANVAFIGNTAGSNGGGAIYNHGALTITNSTFTGNAVVNGGPGGAIQNTTSGTINVTGSTFANNTASGGASGAGIASSGQLTITACRFTGNTADSNGGAVYNGSEGTLNVSTTTFAGNSSGSDGGGIENSGAATVTASTFSGNTAASEGGGIGNQGTTLTLSNCTLYGNTASSDGGGLNTSGPATLTNCTITANRVTSGTNGVFGGGIYAQSVAPKIYNTIVAGNFQGAAPSTTADDIAGTLDSTSAYNLIGTGGAGGLVNNVNNNQVGVANPGLGTLADNGGLTMTVSLLTGSSAINRGSNIYVTAGTTDQRGLTRIVGGTVDIGAFEVQ